jgi:hypothetical protein
MKTTEQDRFNEYAFFGDVDTQKIRKLHELVVEYSSRFFEDNALQDLLMNRGFEVDERPKDWFSFGGACWNRKKVILHLAFLNMMMGAATKPRLAVVKSPLIVVPGQYQEARTETPEGWDAEVIEQLQEEWLRNSEVSQTVREYHNVLSDAFGQYNLQWTLWAMHHCLISFIDPMFEDEARYQKRIKKVMTPEGYTALDSAYYNAGNRSFRAAGNLWEKLNASEFGRKFILDQKTVQQGLAYRK